MFLQQEGTVMFLQQAGLGINACISLHKCMQSFDYFPHLYAPKKSFSSAALSPLKEVQGQRGIYHFKGISSSELDPSSSDGNALGALELSLRAWPGLRGASAEHPKLAEPSLCSAQILDSLKLSQGCWAGDQSHGEGVWTQGPGERVAIKQRGPKANSSAPSALHHLHVCTLAVLQSSRGNGMQQVPGGAEGDFGC